VVDLPGVLETVALLPWEVLCSLLCYFRQGVYCANFPASPLATVMGVLVRCSFSPLSVTDSHQFKQELAQHASISRGYNSTVVIVRNRFEFAMGIVWAPNPQYISSSKGHAWDCGCATSWSLVYVMEWRMARMRPNVCVITLAWDDRTRFRGTTMST